MSTPRVLFAGGGTGGHLYPALNLARALLRAEPRARIAFLGAARGVEARILPEGDYPYRLLPFQPLHRSQVWRNWWLLWTAPRVLTGLASAFRRYDPQLVVGTGGYASGPAVLWGRLGGRRTAIQEQNADPGLVTRLLAPRVDQIHLGYPEAERRLRPGRNTRVFTYGNPVATADGAAHALYEWPSGPVLLVAGGSQGARGLNRRLLDDLEAAARDGSSRGAAVAATPGPSAREGPGASSSAVAPSGVPGGWPAGASVVWVAGPAHREEVAARVRSLPWADRIDVVAFIEGLGAQLSRVSLAVARAGAMFVSELAAAGVPAIFVPFPAAAGGHQSANARAMVEAGAALMREESALAPGELWDLARGLLVDEAKRRAMARASRARGAPEAADRIASELLDLCGRAGGTVARGEDRHEAR